MRWWPLAVLGCADQEPGPPAHLVPTTPPSDSAAPPRPLATNVVLLVADDLGVGDTSLVPGGRVPTPRLARLAAQGVHYARAYAAAAVCSPSRAALLTGRSPQSFGFEYNVGPVPLDLAEGRGIPGEVPTAGERFRAAGLRTALFGKWHLGSGPGFYPTDRGFEDFYGVLAGATPYIDVRVEGVQMVEVPPEISDDGEVIGFNQTHRDGGLEVVEGPDRVVDEAFDRYLTDVLAERAARYIGEHASERFFLTVTFTAPHTPLQVTAEYHDRFAHVADPALRVYSAMVSALDDGVGRVLDALDEAGLADRTLVIFTSDNGCAGASTTCDCALASGIKGTFLDGGVRVPLVARWPEGLPAGATCDLPTSLLDVLPTALGAAGLQVPAELEGRALGALSDACGAGAETLAWRATPQKGLLHGGHKLLADEAAGTSALYALAADPFERTDLSAEDPALLEDLRRRLAAWEAGQSPSSWEPGFVGSTEGCGGSWRVTF